MFVEILDKTLPGEVSNSFHLELEELTTPQEIIEARVHHEVALYNKKADKKINKNALIQPTKREQALNGEKELKLIDAEQQVYIALEGFKQNAFFILVDDQQVTELDQKITLKSESTINFIKLTPLVGG